MAATVRGSRGRPPLDTGAGHPSTRRWATKAGVMGPRARWRPVGGPEPDQLADCEFLAAVGRGAEPSGHLGNLRLAWLLVPSAIRSGRARAALALRRRAVRTGGSVHETRTAAWVALVRAATSAAPDVAAFEELFGALSRAARPAVAGASLQPGRLGASACRDDRRAGRPARRCRRGSAAARRLSRVPALVRVHERPRVGLHRVQRRTTMVHRVVVRVRPRTAHGRTGRT